MDSSQPIHPVKMEHDFDDLTTTLLTPWEWRDSANGDIVSGQQRTLHCVSSPDSSFDSMCSSPEMPGNPGGCQQLAGFSYTQSGHNFQRTLPKTYKAKLSTKRRIKASEREKMRMRSLAEALHNLRDYLPPARRGQTLTKIQTLKCTIEYIKELSDILGHS